MRFNWLRFVEYSASGSLVLFTGAILVGVTDANLLACMFVLSATCMFLGIAAEIFLRVKNALKMIIVVPQRMKPDQHQGYLNAAMEYLNEKHAFRVDSKEGFTDMVIHLSSAQRREVEAVLQDHAQLIQQTKDTLECVKKVETGIVWLRIGFWLTHILGWVCLVPPWAIGWMYLDRWYRPCGAETLRPSSAFLRALGVQLDDALGDGGDEAAQSGRAPPDFVRVSFSFFVCVRWMPNLLLVPYFVRVRTCLVFCFGEMDAELTFCLCVQGIVAFEIVLFGLFGLVQLFETLFLKGRNRASEMVYIFLSLLAKTSLGITLFFNVLFL